MKGDSAMGWDYFVNGKAITTKVKPLLWVLWGWTAKVALPYDLAFSNWHTQYKNTSIDKALKR